MRALKRDEKVHDALQLIVQKSIQACLTALTADESSTLTDEAIHDIRKQVKTVRSLLRLMRSDMGDHAYQHASRCLREANRPLSDTRDAKVIFATYNKLMARRNTLTAPRMRIQRTLEGRLRKARARVAGSTQTKRRIAQRLRTAEHLVRHCRASHGSWKNISRGVHNMYAKGRDAFETAAADKSDANLHELRKRAKDLLYTCTFLRKLGPLTRAMSADLKRFTDLLGAHRDLAMLQRASAARWLVRENSLREKIADMAAREQASLCNRAWRIGSRVYGSSPTAFVNRLHRAWKAWRRS